MATLEEAYNNLAAALGVLKATINNCEDAVETLQASIASLTNAQSTFSSSIDDAILVMNAMLICANDQAQRLCNIIGDIADSEAHSDAMDEVL